MATDLNNVIDIRDGLNTQIRKILSVLLDNLPSSGPFRRSSKVVALIKELYGIDSEVCYDTIVDLAIRNWPMPLVDGHGNFSFFPAAPDYSECRCSSFLNHFIAKGPILEDLNVPFKMPLPVLLFRGTPGFYHSSTKIPQHSFTSVIKAVLFLLMNPSATTKDLVQIIKGPDLYVGGTIINTEELSEIYEKGFGEIRYTISRKTLNPQEWGSIKEVCDEFCSWYGHKLTKPEGAKKGYYEIAVEYNALFYNGNEARHYSLKEILQAFIDNYRIIVDKQLGAPADDETVAKSFLNEVKRMLECYNTDVFAEISQYFEILSSHQ